MDREAFLRAIRADPADDTVRLVYADWLDEHGDPEQAEFVRLQIELDARRDHPDEPRVRDLAEREAILLALHGHRWLGDAADVAGGYPAFGPVFRRGFPEMVCLRLDRFVERAADLFAACPTVREVSLFDVAGRGAELAACPHLNHVETLELADVAYPDDAAGATALAQAVQQARTRHLRLPTAFTPDVGQALVMVIATGWPRWVEFVQHRPGHPPDTVGYAEALDAVAGRPVTRFVRPFEARFPLAADAGYGFHPGTEEGGEPVLLALRPDGSGVWDFFDAAGRRTGDAPFTPAGFDPAEWSATRGATIRVREFEAAGLALRLWPEAYTRDFLREPFDRPPGVSDRWWHDRGGVLRRWLHEGRFALAWDGHEYWADSSGRIIGG
jgi:uncharacterized protein (TIGR02996 family)